MTLVTAAKVLRDNGHHRGDYWSGHGEWRETIPVCLAGAIAVALDVREKEAAAAVLLGDPFERTARSCPFIPCPALGAVMAFMDVQSPELVFGFSDNSSHALVIATLEGAAEALLAGELGAIPGITA